MTVEKIRETLANPARPVTEALYQAAQLADRRNMRTLASWTNAELTGYASDAELPGYRKPILVAIRSLGFPSAFGVLGMVELTKDLYEPREALAVYEHFSKSQLTAVFIEKFSAYSSRNIRATGLDRAIKAHISLPIDSIKSIVDGARSKLSYFIAELDAADTSAGFHGNTEAKSTVADQMDQRAKTIIYASGGVNMSDYSVTTNGTTANVVGGSGNRARQGDANLVNQTVDLSRALDQLNNALSSVEGPSKPALHAIFEAVQEEVSSEQPSKSRIGDLLRSLVALAKDVGTAAPAIISGVEAVQKTIGS